MDDAGNEDIDALDARIEALEGTIERCRKISLAARVTIVVAAIVLVLLLTGTMTFAPYSLVASLAAIIGGIVLAGSNASTWAQCEEDLRKSQALRDALIGRMPLRVVSDDHSIPTLPDRH